MVAPTIHGTPTDSLTRSDLLAAPTTIPSAPNTFWLELPGRYLRITPPFAVVSGQWSDAAGNWYDSQNWSDT